MKKKTLIYSFIGFFAALAIIQAIPVEKSNPPVEMEVPAPEQVRTILHRACYDCHSNETVWPWYGNIAPVSWLVANDVREGRAEINFSTWNRYDAGKQSEILRKTWKEVREDEMPPLQYRVIHPESLLTAEDKSTVRIWAASTER